MTSREQDPSTLVWREAFEHFERLCALDPAGVAAALAQLQRERPDLHAPVVALLRAHGEAQAGGFLDVPLVGGHTATEPLPPLEPGTTQGPYRLERTIGAGGMGEVWLARRADGLFEAPVALKFLHEHLLISTLRERFVREGRILGQLSHPNIAHLLDAGSLPGNRLYLAIEHVEGERIDRWCDAQRLSVESRVRLFLQVCDAVAHAHARLVVHRDLKPSNVLVTPDGEVKLLDFGIAKLIERDETSSEPTELTRLGGRALTPEYAAPEQILGAPITTATDVYSLGMILYVLLCGRRPYGAPGATVAQLERDAIEVDPDPPSTFRFAAGEQTIEDVAGLRGTSATQLRATLRGDLDTIVKHALRKAPAERYASVSALADDLRRYLDHRPVLARPDSLAYRARKYVRRHRAALAIAASLAILVLGAIVAVIVNARATARHAAEVAAREARLREVVEFQGAMLDRVNVPAFGKGFQQRVVEGLDRRLRQGETPHLPDREAVLAILAQLPAHVNLTDVARESLVAGLLAPAEAEMEARFAQRPDVLAALYDSLAQSYEALGQWAQMEALSGKAAALHLRDAANGANAALASRTRRASAMLELGRYAEGLAEAEGVVAERLRRLGPDHPDTWTSQGVVANALGKLKRFEEARALQEPLVAKLRERFGDAGEATIAMRGSLGATLQGAGEDDAAAALLQKAAADATQRYGPLHAKTVALRISHAQAVASSLAVGKAAALLEPLIEELRDAFGEDDPRMLDAIGALATAYYHAGDHEEVLELDEQVAASRLRLYGPDDVQLLKDRYNIAMGHVDLGRPARGREILEDVCPRRVRVLGARNPETLSCNLGIAVALRALRVPQEQPRARQLAEDALEGLEAAMGPAHPWTVVAHDELATLCLRTGDMACACEHGQIAFDFYSTKREFPPSAEARLGRMAACRRALGDEAAAVAFEKRRTGIAPKDPP